MKEIVLFLGAGFSKAWGLPVMDDFFKIAREHKRLSDEDKDFLQAMRKEAREGSSMLDETDTNFEHALSFTLISHLTKSENSQVNTSFERLCSVLERICSDVDIELVSKSYDYLTGFLGKLDGSNPLHLTVITTNYDVMAEYALKTIGRPATLPCNWSRIDNDNRQTGSLYARNAENMQHHTVLCKLHGSLNWHTDLNDPSRFFIEDRIHTGHYLIEGKESAYSKPMACHTDYSPRLTPFLIPPTFFKLHENENLNLCWLTAGEALEKADRLAFIGYSFPSSDTHMRYFLANHLAKNFNLEHIEIINPEADSICSRLKEKNTPNFGSRFKDLLHPIQTQWASHKNYCVS